MTAALVRAALKQLGRATLWADGNSMGSAIVPGTKLVVARRSFDDVEVGDVVAIDCAGAVVVHRVGWRNTQQLATIGDSLPLFDPPVTATNYLGTVVEPTVPPSPDRPSALKALASHQTTPGSLEIVLAPATAAARLRSGVTTHSVRTSFREPTFTVGVSPEGGLPPTTLPMVLCSASTVRVLVGWRFGRTSDDDPTMLPPETASIHVRPHDEPHRPVEVDEVLNIILTAATEEVILV